MVSVAAVDRNQRWAKFSQHNEYVDFAAPGVGIKSTAPPSSLLKISDSNNEDIRANMLANSATPGSGKSGHLVNCWRGRYKCPGGCGQICIILTKGTKNIESKVLNCQKGGGMSVILISNSERGIKFALPRSTKVSIPVLSVSDKEGSAILNNLGRSGRVELQGRYEYYSGTSMVSVCCISERY